MTEDNVNSLIALADSHPEILSLLIVSLAVTFMTVCVGIYFLAKFLVKRYRKVKLPGGGELTADGEEIKKQEIPQELTSNKEINKIIQNNNKQLIKTLATIINFSVQSGFDRSVKRQELFSRQLQFAHIRLDVIKNSIINEYLKEPNASSYIKIIEVFLDYIFQECAYVKLEGIFKADRLIEKTKDALVESNRFFIENVATNMVHKAIGLQQTKVSMENLSVSYFDDRLANLIDAKSSETKRAITDIIEKAYDIALEEMDKMNELHNDLTEKINNALLSYLGDEQDLPPSWNDTLPPNDIIGDFKLV